MLSGKPLLYLTALTEFFRGEMIRALLELPASDALIKCVIVADVGIVLFDFRQKEQPN